MLRLADLERSKNAVLHSLGAASSQESYGHAIDDFIGWCCSEPRLAFNRTVVLRYRFFLVKKNLAPSTINVRLAAVRRLAYEASDTGLLSPDLAHDLALVYETAKQKGNSNRATLAVAREMVAYLLAVDRVRACRKPETGLWEMLEKRGCWTSPVCQLCAGIRQAIWATGIERIGLTV